MRLFRIRKEHIPILLISIGINVLLLVGFIGIGVYVFRAHGLSIFDTFIAPYLPLVDTATSTPIDMNTATSSAPTTTATMTR